MILDIGTGKLFSRKTNDNFNIFSFSFCLYMQWQENMTSAKVGTQVRLRITDDETHNISYYGAEISPPTDHGTTHLSIYGPNGDAVALTSTINDW